MHTGHTQISHSHPHPKQITANGFGFGAVVCWLVCWENCAKPVLAVRAGLLTIKLK